ncbi:MAG: acyltransferase family protein [Lachnospiraceae bacterium]
MMKSYLEKNESNFMKGIAILLMLMTHLFGAPDWIETTLNVQYSEIVVTFSKGAGICVAIFAFLTGYALYPSVERQIDANLFKIIYIRGKKFLIRYWLMMLCFHIPINLLIGKNDLLDIKMLFLNMFAINHRVVRFSWYVTFYLLVLLVTPIVIKFFYKNKYFMEGLCIFVILQKIILNGFVSSHFDIFYNIWLDFSLYFPIVLIGCMVYKYGFINKIIQYISSVPEKFSSSIACVLFLGIIYFRGAFAKYVYYQDYITIIIVCMLIIISNLHSRIAKVIILIGEKHSMNIWFIHSIFFFDTSYLQRYIYVTNNFICVLMIVLFFSLLISIGMNRIYKFVEKQ